MSKQTKKKTWLIGFILFLSIIATLVLSLNLGVIRISPLEIFRTVTGNGDAQNEMVLFQFRLPRMTIALLIGAGMAISGALLQSVTRNELADPGIIGINAGAGFAVVLYIFLFEGNAVASSSLSIYMMPLSALIGAVTAAVLIYAISWKNGVSPIRLVLVGIGINSAFAALIIIFQLKMNPDDFTRATVWLSGNISGTDWSYVLALLPWILLFVPLAIYKGKSLNTLYLGEDVAQGLGTKVERERMTVLFIAVALAGASVAVGGGIAFLGLVVPHLSKKLVGPTHERFLPISALMGALLLVVADTIGRNILAPSEIPVGLIVSIIGGSYFIYLLMKT
ncbi:iron chelate uptake ABC transporter family permease subunit [Sediminibacillus dalangtanensis]|uniref:Iron chelate uptake ABC transporter family permease subunit n=1 Tax=Sediminibacillus dalangtanensis TaxID=2729421 RepID=A0ABX7VNN1_9BACI|nr:iron ABC transporter permease [Sediminibacillus dalangtanensis]QTM98479.1 iron chelate uptake ABC transporter family permease subunit [Sediminibacillus dalangtanensis]